MTVTTTTTGECFNCHGHGRVGRPCKDYFVECECRICRGTGKTPEPASEPCPDCHGTGIGHVAPYIMGTPAAYSFSACGKCGFSGTTRREEVKASSAESYD